MQLSASEAQALGLIQLGFDHCPILQRPIATTTAAHRNRGIRAGCAAVENLTRANPKKIITTSCCMKPYWVPPALC